MSSKLHQSMIVSFFGFEEKCRRMGMVACLLTLSIVVASGCSNEPKGPLEELQAQDKYHDWQIYTHKRVKILHPEAHPQEEHFELISEGYLRSANSIAGRLGMPPFRDTLYIVFYTGFGQGRDMTAQHWPFVRDGIIHFWRPCFVGLTLADFMAQRWSDQWPSRDIFHHGLRTLFDFSGENYHARTGQLIDSNLFVPLSELALSEKFVSDSERVYSAEAASLVAYILAAYSAGEFKQLYEAEGPFDSVVREHLGTGVDSLEIGWLEFVRYNLPDDTSTRE